MNVFEILEKEMTIDDELYDYCKEEFGGEKAEFFYGMLAECAVKQRLGLELPKRIYDKSKLEHHDFVLDGVAYDVKNRLVKGRFRNAYYTVQDSCDAEVFIFTKYEERTVKFVGTLKRMEVDVYGHHYNKGEPIEEFNYKAKSNSNCNILNEKQFRRM